MAKDNYVVCINCGKTDVPDKTVIPHEPGTSTKMQCFDCATDYASFAKMCRSCCPSGHGTRFRNENIQKQ